MKKKLLELLIKSIAKTLIQIRCLIDHQQLKFLTRSHYFTIISDRHNLNESSTTIVKVIKLITNSEICLIKNK